MRLRTLRKSPGAAAAGRARERAGPASPANYLDWRGQSHAFAALAAAGDRRHAGEALQE